GAADFFAQVGTPALVVDARGLVRDANPAFERLAGRPRARLVGASLAALLLPDEAALARRMARALRRGRAESVSAELRLQRADGTSRWVEVMASRRAASARGSDAVALSPYFVLVRDVDREARRLAALAADLTHDSVTGAVSLETLRTRAARVFGPGRTAGETALVVLEVERLAALGTSHGAAAADAVLATLAARLQAATRGSDVVARVAADRFAVLITGMAAADHVRVVVERLQRAATGPIPLAGGSLTVAVRTAVVPALDASDADDLLARGLATLHATRWGEPLPRRGGPGRFAIEAGLRRLLAGPPGAPGAPGASDHARAGAELWLAYQPVVDLASGALVAVEALCRWTDPVHGAIAPTQFVPVAEAAGLDGALGTWVLGRACAQLAAWRAAAPAAARLALHVNLSAAQLADPHLPRIVTDIAEREGVPLAALVLEVTETALAQHPEHAAAPLAAVRATGVRLALDDFGTGYSSLAALARLPLDVLKIDRRFIADLRESGRPAELARTVIALGDTLGLDTVAEGIEHEGDAARVRALVPTAQAQGWHYGRPVRGDELLPWITAPGGARTTVR
ncbi:MAG TPA: EAL domain-containing protein, partial [Gemmatirosa sp.]|nr:EAL domain-containing protein [Gemmatirosa sp.]